MLSLQNRIDLRRSPLFGVLAVVLLGWTAGHAQQSAAPNPELPSGPLLKSVPEFSQWEIEVTHPIDPANTRKSEKAQAGRIVTTKTGDIIHETTDHNGQRSEKWFVGPLQYTKASGRREWLESDGSVGADGARLDPDYSPLPASGFRDLEWVTAGTYCGVFRHEDRECLVFVPLDLAGVTTHPRTVSKEFLDAQDTLAYIDAESRLPVLARIGGENRVYRFKPAPTEMQLLPLDISGQMEKGEAARSRLLEAPPRPY